MGPSSAIYLGQYSDRYLFCVYFFRKLEKHSSWLWKGQGFIFPVVSWENKVKVSSCYAEKRTDRVRWMNNMKKKYTFFYSRERAVSERCNDIECFFTTNIVDNVWWYHKKVRTHTWRVLPLKKISAKLCVVWRLYQLCQSCLEYLSSSDTIAKLYRRYLRALCPNIPNRIAANSSADLLKGVRNWKNS